MSQTPINKSLVKNVCKHKAGDRWKDGCCGEDLLAKNYFGHLEDQENESITSAKQIALDK
ncbi:MAG: hypothetical protein RMX96_33165 [Nostoc sp. ChiSLP02]|nr:hypothetical protein [Nostoc sp. DedSLP05]MDZ8103566.1 hypothetical protein [Nostoc sp. DedSLP01]MDZ8189675.1 hypothetical protein [Nostoc sp. ChiSLP02]